MSKSISQVSTREIQDMPLVLHLLIRVDKLYPVILDLYVEFIRDEPLKHYFKRIIDRRGLKLVRGRPLVRQSEHTHRSCKLTRRNTSAHRLHREHRGVKA